MGSLSSAPFARILPAFCTGIVCSFYRLADERAVVILFFAGITGLFFFLTRKKPDYKLRCGTGFTLQIIYFLISFTLTEMKDDRKSELYFTNFPGNNSFVALVENPPAGRDNNLRATVNIISVMVNGKFNPAKGSCYVYFRNDTNAFELSPGDEIIFNGLISPILPPLNPGQFDFKYRSSVHRIYHQAYLKNYEWRKLPVTSSFNLKQFSAGLRDKFLSMYKDAGLTGQEYAVLSALVLGYEDEIDRNTMKAFSASGTLHILSVSGMHVGIIFTALSALLVFLERKKSTRLIRLFILLAALWFYALLTGLSPSVIRSAMMLSFILVGRSLNRSSNIYNSLSLSALCIFILFDPLMLFEAGLQLSFLAVGGIAFLYPKIYKWFYFENKLLDKTWALIAVSLAAQLATFAISIYYFHQFPNYFIPANLIIIPISTAGIFAGIILLFISPFHYLSVKAGWLVHLLIYLLNNSAIFIEELPGAVWHNISINMFELVVIYALLFSIVLFLGKRSILYLYLFLIFCSILFASFINKNFIRLRKDTVLFFSNTSSFSCQVSDGFNSILIYHAEDSLKVFSYSDNYCINRGLSIRNREVICLDSISKKLTTEDIYISGNYLLYGKYLIADFSDYNKINHRIKYLKTNIIYTKNNLLQKLIFDDSPPEEVIVNGMKNSYYKKTISEITGSKISYLSDGSREIELNF